MRIDVLGLEAFVSVASLGSFTRAGEHLNLSQTAVTHRIGKLERRLGTRLFTRSARGLSLTPAGAALLPKVGTLLDHLSAELDSLCAWPAERAETLALACLPTLATEVLPSVVSSFVAAHPGVVLRILDTVAVEIPALVRNGTAEFGITIAAAGSDELAMEALFSEDYVLVCSREDELGKRRRASWSELRESQLIRVSPQTANRFVLDRALGNQGDALNWTCEVQHTATALSLVRAGVGATIVPRSATRDVELGDTLRIVELTAPRVRRTIGLLTHRRGNLSPLAKAFCSLLRTRLKPARQ